MRGVIHVLIALHIVDVRPLALDFLRDGRGSCFVLSEAFVIEKPCNDTRIDDEADDERNKHSFI